MNETTFDALAASETLAQAGFDERQAKAVAGVMRRAVEADRDKLATKADLTAGLAALEARLKAVFEARLKAEIETGLASVRAELETGLAALEARLRADFETGLAALETRLTVRFFGGLLAMGSLNVAAVAALKLFG